MTFRYFGQPPMTDWTDNRKPLWAGIPGLQYRTCMSCGASREDAVAVISGYFRSHGAVPSAEGDGQTLTFTRGCQWLLRLARWLPAVARWPQQTITVVFTALPQALVVKVGYEARMPLGGSGKSAWLTREVCELQGLLRSNGRV